MGGGCVWFAKTFDSAKDVDRLETHASRRIDIIATVNSIYPIGQIGGAGVAPRTCLEARALSLRLNVPPTVSNNTCCVGDSVASYFQVQVWDAT